MANILRISPSKSGPSLWDSPDTASLRWAECGMASANTLASPCLPSSILPNRIQFTSSTRPHETFASTAADDAGGGVIPDSPRPRPLREHERPLGTGRTAFPAFFASSTPALYKVERLGWGGSADFASWKVM